MRRAWAKALLGIVEIPIERLDADFYSVLHHEVGLEALLQRD